ncbi:hypothetical protein FKM82_015464 [Ascaphus truei]
MAALSLPPPNSHLALEMPGGAPRFLCFPRSVTAPAGSQAVLRCRISGDPHPCVLWERVGNFLLELGERCLVQRDGEWYQLVICDLRPEDSGHYMCRASNWAGEGYAGAKLTVTPNLSITTDPHPTATFPCDLPLSTKLPPITTPSPALGSGADFLLSCKADLSVTPDIPPHFLLTPTSQRLSRGQSGELSCRISGKPEPTVRWEKDGRGLEELCDGSHYRVSPGGHSLHISHVRPPDAGVYVCRATNPAGECLAAAVLLVDPTPRQAPEPTPGESPAQVKVFTVNEGKHAKLRCLVTGKPRPEIIWRKDGRAVSPRRRTLIYEDRDGHFILKVLFCRQQDRGLYVCGASNTAGNTLSAVMLHVREVGEQFPAPLRDVSVREGQDAVLECSVPDGSRTSWFLEDQRLHPGKRHHMEEQGLVRRLIIRGARTDDDGVYVCQTQRGSQSIAEVAVRGPIVKRLPRRLEVAEGGNAAFCAETDSEVEQVGWTQDGQVLSEDHRTVLKSFGRTHVLVLVGVTLQDAGIIQFHAGLSESTCQLRVKGRGLRVTPASEEPANRMLHAGQPISLSCHVPSSGAKVRWLKDGREVESGGRFSVQSDGRMRRLIISSAHASDTGSYTCHTANDSASFMVTVTEPPVKIVNTGDDTEHKCLNGERVVLSCEVSRESAPVRWYRDGVEVEETESVRLESDGKHRRLIIPIAGSQDSGEFVCDAGDDSVFYNVTVTETPVKIVNTSDDTEHKCLNGERMVLSCEVSRENAPVRWYRDGVEVEETESVRLESDGKHRRLIIPNARSQDSGEFVCDAGDDSVFYNVTVTEPPVKIMNTGDDTEHKCLSGECVVLSCEVSREKAPVRWYRDGVEVEETENVRLESDGKHRRLIIPTAGIQDSGEFVCDAGDDSVFYNVTVTEPPVKIVNTGDDTELKCLSGERLVLSCEVSRENAPVRWYRDGVEVGESESVRLESDGKHRRLIIPTARTQDSGEFVCDARDDSVFYYVTVTEPPVKIVNTSENTELKCFSGERVVLSCEVSRENAPVRWFRDDVEVEENENIGLESDGKHRRLIIPTARSQDSGEFVCDAGDDSVFYNVTVTAPLVTIVGNTGTPEHHVLMTGDDLVLACELSKPNMKVRWLHDGEELVSGGRVKILARGVHRQITILCARPSDTGTYTCDAATDQMKTTVQVEVPRQVEFVTEVQNVTVLEGEVATFKCVVSPDDVDLLWELNGAPVSSDKRVSMESNGLCHSLTLRSCRFLDSGIITANAEGNISRARLRVQEAQVLFAQGLQDTEVEEEQDVILQVQVTTERAEVHWVKQGVVIQPSSKFTLQDSDRAHSLTIHCVQPSDRGRYSCESLHDRTDCRLTVLPRGISVRKGLKDVQCEEGGKVELSVELSHDDLVGEWWKGGVRLTSSDQCMIKSSGRQHFLHLSALTLPDSGVIAFTTDTLRTTAQLTVTEHPLSITQPPQDFVVNEAGAATFQCEVSKHEVTMTWSKDGVQLIPSSSCRMYSVGRRRILQLSNCRVEDAGTYTCHVGDCTASATLRVLEQEPQMVRDLQDAELAENENAVFTCEVSCAQAKGEWFKNGEKIKITTTTKIRQEGNGIGRHWSVGAIMCRKHFLLMCGVQCQDSGDITFRARRAESRAKLRVTELPVRIVKSLRDKTALQGHRVILECKVTPPRAQVTWLRRGHEINPSSKYQISSDDAFRKLVIADVTPEDEDIYTVSTTGGQSSARLLVEGLAIHLVRGVSAVTVTAPGDACFECELSVPMSRPPQWSLNGILLHSGPDVILENKGTRHKLTLRRTHPRMTGTVRFTAGKTRSEAQLTVKE